VTSVADRRAIVHVNDVAWVAHTLAAAQRRRGDDVELFDLPKPGARLPYPWKMGSIALRMPILVAMALALRRSRFTIIHIHYATQAIIGPLLGRSFIVHCHGSDVRGVGRRTLRGRMLAGLLARATVVLYSTPDLGVATRALRSDAAFLPNPIDVDHFAPGGQPDRDVLVGARLDTMKGAETALAGVDGLLRRRPSTTVTIVANGPLSKAAHALLAGRATFVAPVAHDEMPELIRRHRIAVGQFRVGAMGQFELEAMACGTPVIADFRFPDAYDIPPPIVAARDGDELAGELERLLEDPPRHARLAREAREWVVANHASDMIAERLDRLYRE
jgi:glycosyltransferase involved in cell wall biosynthesis